MSNLVRNTAVTILLMFAATAANAVPDCPPTAGENAMKLRIDEYHLELDNKKPICILVDSSGTGTISIKIHNPPSASHNVEAGDVTVEQKADSPYMIEGDNSDDPDLLELTLSEFGSGAGSDTECGDSSTDICAKFWINVEGVGKLDPRARVIDIDTRIRYIEDIFQGALDDYELDLTLGEAFRILDEQAKGAE